MSMSSSSSVELHLPPTDNDFSPKPKPPPQKLLDRRRSFRDIQSGISKINPELLKSLIASGSVNNSSSSTADPSENGNNVLPSHNSFSLPSTPKEHLNSYPAYPLYIPTFRPSSTSETSPGTPAAFTIFYNGTVAVFDVPPHKAENILKLAQEAAASQSLESTDSKLDVSAGVKQQLLETLNRDLPMARRKSLQRFFEKRKERLTMVSPYDCTTTKQASSDQNIPLPKD